MKFSYLACLYVLSLALASCKDVEGLHVDPFIKMDPSVSEEQQSLLQQDAYNVLHYQLNLPSNSFYQQSFGGAKITALLPYLNDRIQYILASDDTDYLNDRIRTIWLPRLQDTADENSVSIQMASNVGTALWFESVRQNTKIAMKIGVNAVPITSPRVGIIALGPGYTTTAAKNHFSSMDRSAALVHEARHSDCTGGLSTEDKLALKSGRDIINSTCGHSHVLCPPGHPLAGIFACDGHPWGAYAIEWVYANSVAQGCVNCDAVTKSVALMVATDAASRVTNFQSLLAGKAGKPDMTSEGAPRAENPSLQQLISQIDLAQSLHLDVLEGLIKF